MMQKKEGQNPRALLVRARLFWAVGAALLLFLLYSYYFLYLLGLLNSYSANLQSLDTRYLFAIY